MHLSLSLPWNRRRKNTTRANQLTQFRAILRAAQAVEGYRERLSRAGLHTSHCPNAVDDVERVLSALQPVPFERYGSFFPHRRPARRQSPFHNESRSVYMSPYAEARNGVPTCHNPLIDTLELYSAHGLAAATADLYKLGRGLRSTAPAKPAVDQAMVAFTGPDAGLLTDKQREILWNQHQVPLFEHFLGTDGRVVASECEVHAGLHIRTDAAILEQIDGELAITSLTDEASPALRVLSGLACAIESEPCECGRVEPRLVHLRHAVSVEREAAAA